MSSVDLEAQKDFGDEHEHIHTFGPLQTMVQRVSAFLLQGYVLRPLVLSCHVIVWFYWSTTLLDIWTAYKTSPVSVASGCLLLLMSLSSYVAVFSCDAGRVPAGYRVAGETAQAHAEAKEEVDVHHRNRYHRAVRYCGECDAFKPARAHHCSHCRRCTLRMDHHCDITDCCIGLYNQKQFILWLLYATLGMLFALVSFVVRVLDDVPFGAYEWLATVVVGAIMANMLPNAVIMCLQSLNNLKTNTTKIEVWEKHWARVDKGKRNQDFVDPYNRGSFGANFVEIFGSNALLWPLPVPSVTVDGISYPPLFSK